MGYFFALKYNKSFKNKKIPKKAKLNKINTFKFAILINKKEAKKMKKIISIVCILAISALFAFSASVYAQALGSINVTVDKETVHPGEEIKLTIDFGQDLGAYTVNIAYDNQLLEYVSAEGGTENDNGTRVKVYYYDDTVGSKPRRNMSITFRAKEGLTTSNPTEFSITMEGLGSPDGLINYDDVTTPIIKDVTVEPVYENYAITLNYTGDIIKEQEKDMQLVISSAMGKNYEHTRILGEVTTTTGGNAKLLATDSQNLEHDILQSGFGEAQGDPIGGKDVNKVLQVRGLFSKAGDYTITLRLVDRDNSDAEIAKQTFTISVKEETEVTPPEEEKPPEQIPPEGENPESPEPEVPETPATEEDNQNPTVPEVPSPEVEETQPETLPKTGDTVYVAVGTVLALLMITYMAITKKIKG